MTPLQVAQAAEAARRADATEKKVAVLTAGFMKRAASLATQVSSLPSPPFHFLAVTDFQSSFQANGLADASYDKRVLLETYTQVLHAIPLQLPNSCPHPQLREAEQQVLPIRMQELQERLAALQSKESEYQARYSELSRAMAVQ